MSHDSLSGVPRSSASLEEEHAHMLTVLSVSAAMVGVCLTAIGLIQVMEHLQTMETLCDEILAVDALLFLGSCFMSYWALHHRFRSQYRLLRFFVDTLLILGITLMVFICGMIAYSLV